MTQNIQLDLVDAFFRCQLCTPSIPAAAGFFFPCIFVDAQYVSFCLFFRVYLFDVLERVFYLHDS